MLPTVAIAEDEGDLREAVAEYLEGRGFRIIAAADAAEFRRRVEGEAVQVALLDIAMPGENGLSLARWMRQRPERPGIIFATASATPIDRIIGLEVGGDDYVVKPYDLRELLARIRSVLRRLPPAAGCEDLEPAPAVTRVGAFAIDLCARRVSRPDGATLDLTSIEFDTLVMLTSHPNRVLTRAQLLGAPVGWVGRDSERSVDIRVTRLRRKIDTGSGRPSLIRTVRGEGYMYVPQPAC